MLTSDEKVARLAAQVREKLWAHHQGWQSPIVFRIGSDEIIADAILQAMRQVADEANVVIERLYAQLEAQNPPADIPEDGIVRFTVPMKIPRESFVLTSEF